MPMLIDTIDDPVARAVCDRHANRPDTLIEILHGIQSEAGFVSDAAMATLADALNLSRAEILGVVSFYHDFKRQPGARHTLKLCRAEACQSVGAEAVAAAIEARLGALGVMGGDAPSIEIRPVYCLGNCALGPAALIDETPLGRVSVDRVMQQLIARGVIEGETA